MAARSDSGEAVGVDALEARARRAFQSGDGAALDRICGGILEADASNVTALELLGVAAMQSGDLRRAEQILRQATESHPREARLANTLGVILARQNRPAEAIDCYRSSIELEPSYMRPYVNLGNALCGQGRIDAGVALYEEAIALEPQQAEPHQSLGNAQRKLGQLDAAAESYRRALALQPGLVGAQINLGALLCQKGELDESALWLGRALEADPRSVGGLINLGIVKCRQRDWAAAVMLLRRALDLEPGNLQALLQLGRSLAGRESWDEALAVFEKAAAIDPGAAEAHLGIGDVLKAQRKWPEASAAYLRMIETDPTLARRHKHFYLGLACGRTGDFETAAAAMLAPIKHLHGPRAAFALDPVLEVPRAKLVHDVEQLAFLRAEGCLGAEEDPVIAEYGRALAELSRDETPDLVALDTGSYPRLASHLYRLKYLAAAPALPGGALNKALDCAAVEAAYLAENPGATHVDDLLSPEALESLQRFCLYSTIWWRFEHATEVGSGQASGFACPLLLQIAHELRQALPGLLGAHPFTTMWAYKYFDPPGREGAQNTSTGRRIHADDGLVSVNLWITPDAANLGPEPGGVEFWDRVAPADYFEARSREERQEMLRPFIEAAGAPRLVVAHRCNRAAIFHSNLLHRSSPQNFRDSYADRKISITMMFGHRTQADRDA